MYQLSFSEAPLSHGSFEDQKFFSALSKERKKISSVQKTEGNNILPF
jgi:hypothetical protein